MAKGRTTEVEVSAVVLDGAAPPPGRLTRVQLKTLRQGGAVVSAKNFNGQAGGAHFKTTLDDARRGQTLPVQADVRGIDGSRTVSTLLREGTLQTNVSLRPARLCRLSLDEPTVLQRDVFRLRVCV